MIPIHRDPWFTFRFGDDRIISRFHLEGVEAGLPVSVFKIHPVTGERLEMLAKATVGDGGWVDLAEPIIVSAGDAFIAETKNELSIRPYAEADEAQVIRIWREVFPDNPSWNVPKADIDRKLAVQRELFLVGDLDGEIVATVMAGFDGHRGWVHLVAVAPAHRKKGHGKLMMEEAEKRLREIGCTKINLQVRATNQGVVSFYEKLGYAVEERVSMGKKLQ